MERRFQQSGLADRKTVTDFDWGFNPKIPKKACFELMTCKFIQSGEDAVLIGAPGTGKSHIAKTVAHAATVSGYRVLYREAHLLFPELFEATRLGIRQKKSRVFAEADLVVIDDLFLRKKLPEDAADDLQEIIMNRYTARKSTLITSNRIIEDWGKCLGDNAVASAILDRLLHHGNLLKFEGKSYRLKEAALRLTKE
jgi:DNA replication protein DnaC